MDHTTRLNSAQSSPEHKLLASQVMLTRENMLGQISNRGNNWFNIS